ncbi:hypothetical protein RIF29_33448 [Crotalaria pallida]|uniref:Uncharacterized protein n=1 Tax=Crotalaria pallida TaxID=3830 RepID=A0AAN9HU24_CROPI
MCIVATSSAPSELEKRASKPLKDRKELDELVQLIGVDGNCSKEEIVQKVAELIKEKVENSGDSKKKGEGHQNQVKNVWDSFDINKVRDAEINWSSLNLWWLSKDGEKAETEKVAEINSPKKGLEAEAIRKGKSIMGAISGHSSRHQMIMDNLLVWNVREINKPNKQRDIISVTF